MLNIKTMSLRIPPTWGIIQNKWYDVDPIIEGEDVINTEAFDEDLLVLYQCNTDKGQSFAKLPNGCIVDMAWRPIWRADGSYVLNVIRGTWANKVYTYETRDRFLMRSIIEQCLVLITEGVSDLDIPSHILERIDI